MQRRTVLKGWLALAALPLCLVIQKVQAAAWFVQAFEAKHTAEVMSALQAQAVPVSQNIHIQAPQKAENGSVVQVEISSTQAASAQAAGSISTLRLLADANPTPLIASFELGKQVLPKLVTRIKLAQSGDLIALIQQKDGQFQQQRRSVIVLEDGCAGSEREEPFASSMKMRARPLEDGTVELKIIIVHPMRTGRSKNDEGVLMPAHFMQLMQVLLNGQLIVDAQTGTGISRNPYFTFYLKEAKVGDVIAVHWQDNRGFEGQGQVIVTQ
jgi:thiosulfate oxidation carrier complex protein SoxZ